MIRKLMSTARSFRRLAEFKIAFVRHLISNAISIINERGIKTFLTKLLFYCSNPKLIRKFLGPKRSLVNYRLNAVQAKGFEELPLVSVIIPIWDRTDILRDAILSIMNQTFQNFELLLITDGSPENTMKVVNQYRHDSRVKIFSFPSKSGNAVRGRNKGILEAKGKYIAFLDSDDLAETHRLEVCLPYLESGEADVIYGAWRAVIEEGRQIDKLTNGQVVIPAECNLERLKTECVICQSTTMVRKELFTAAGFLKRSMSYREDHELWARLAYYGAKFKPIPYILASLRLHSGNNELNFINEDQHWKRRFYEEYCRPGLVPQKIVFILPGIGISGGIAVVLKHANMLIESGHDAAILNIGVEGVPGWYPDNQVPIYSLNDEAYLWTNADLLIATAWNTAEFLTSIPSKRRLYFVQSDERRFYGDTVLRRNVEQTYRLQVGFFTEAKWIQDMLLHEFGHSSYYVPNGLDPELFFPGQPLKEKNAAAKRVLIEGPIDVPFKGMKEAYAAVQDLECEIWIISSSGRPPGTWRYSEFFHEVRLQDMRKIYSACDVFLKMSRVEGFFGPPMEAMACGCAVVIAKVTGWNEYITDGYNAIVVDEGDISGAQKAVAELLANDELRNTLIANGLNTVKKWTWERSHAHFLKLLHEDPSPQIDNVKPTDLLHID